MRGFKRARMTIRGVMTTRGFLLKNLVQVTIVRKPYYLLQLNLKPYTLKGTLTAPFNAAVLLHSTQPETVNALHTQRVPHTLPLWNQVPNTKIGMDFLGPNSIVRVYGPSGYIVVLFFWPPRRLHDVVQPEALIAQLGLKMSPDYSSTVICPKSLNLNPIP